MSAPAYFVFNVTAIHDPEGMLPYQEKVLETVTTHKGTLIVGGGEVETVEGPAAQGKFFVVRFDSMEAAKAWYHSPAYQSIIGYRHAAATGQATLLAGLLFDQSIEKRITMKTLVVVSHPTPEQSVAIKALQQVAEGMDSVSVRHLDQLYSSDIGHFDIAAEQQAHEAADRIIYLYPTHWFNTTPMLKAYLNQVWTYGWAFGPNGTALQGKELQIVTTAGATEFTYSQEGLIRSTMDEVLSPMKASALYVGMKYNAPLAFYSAMGLNGEQLELIKRGFAERLQAPLGAIAQA